MALRPKLLWPALLGLFLSSAAGCGAAPAGLPPPDAPFVPHAFLRAHAATATALFREPFPSADDARAEARAADDGASRRVAERRLAIALAEGGDGDEKPRARRKRTTEAARVAERSARGEQDAFAAAESDFVALWVAWRTDAGSAARLADRFVERHADSVELYALASAVRGELALGRSRWSDARDAYRAILGNIDHPLYAYALYRTAAAHDGAQEPNEAKQAREEAMQLGCARGANAPTMTIALRAAHELRVPVRRDPDGAERPDVCPPGGRERTTDDILEGR